MKILVTGGAGFIGANFIAYALKAHPGDEIVCLDALTYAGNLASLKGARHDPRFRFVRGSIADPACVERLFREARPEAVVNFAAESHVDRSLAQPGKFLHTNVLGTQVLMDACRRHGIRRFHQISTDEVYGDLPLGRPDLLFHEDSPLRPSSPYAASKASADLLALAYHRTYGLPVSITRSSNNYGPFQHPEKLIPLMILRARADQKLPLYGDGAHVRDWLYVQDHCEAVDMVLRRGEPGRVYNVGGRSERANLEVVRAILQELGKPESLIQRTADRPGHDRRYGIDAGRMERELGWRPRTAFAQGLAATVSWYLNSAEWQKARREQEDAHAF